jgi:hypothetical protein
MSRTSATLSSPFLTAATRLRRSSLTRARRSGAATGGHVESPETIGPGPCHPSCRAPSFLKSSPLETRSPYGAAALVRSVRISDLSLVSVVTTRW